VMRAEVEPVRIEGARLGELYLRHGDAAVRLAYLITGDRALAEDLAQDPFVKLAGRLLHLRDPGGFEQYLRRTIVNLANSYFRRKKVEHRYAERQAGLRQPPGQDPDVPAREMLRNA